MPGEVAAANLNDLAILNRHIAAAADIQRSKFAERALVDHPIALQWFRVWDAMASLLPAAGASDDLGLVTGTFGTDSAQIQTGDVKALGATTRRARVLISLPGSYDAAGDVALRAIANMKTTLADTSAVIDIEAYKVNADGTLSSDLVTTSAISINTGVNTPANRDFTLTATSLNPGDRLDVRVTFTVTDAAGATAVIGVLHALLLRCDVRP